MAPPIELREPAEDELDFSSDSSIGSESEVEIMGAMGPSIMSSPMKRKKWAVVTLPAQIASAKGAQVTKPSYWANEPAL